MHGILLKSLQHNLDWYLNLRRGGAGNRLSSIVPKTEIEYKHRQHFNFDLYTDSVFTVVSVDTSSTPFPFPADFPVAALVNIDAMLRCVMEVTRLLEREAANMVVDSSSWVSGVSESAFLSTLGIEWRGEEKWYASEEVVCGQEMWDETSH